jgi:hypothetical protein
MSAFKKIAGLITGLSAVGVIGVAVAQSVPPNPQVSNPAIGAGQQMKAMTPEGPVSTPMGETGVLAWEPGLVQQAAVITPQDEQAAVASQPAPQPAQPVAAADTSSSDTSSQEVAQAPSNDNQDYGQMGAGPSQDTGEQQHAPRSDRG